MVSAALRGEQAGREWRMGGAVQGAPAGGPSTLALSDGGASANGGSNTDDSACAGATVRATGHCAALQVVPQQACSEDMRALLDAKADPLRALEGRELAPPLILHAVDALHRPVGILVVARYARPREEL